MIRFGPALAVSLSLHLAVFAADGFVLSSQPKVGLSPGKARVVTLSISSAREEGFSEKPSEKKADLPSPPPEEGVQYSQPAYRRNLPPPYPREAFLQSIQGTVWIVAAIDREGQVANAEVEKSSGSSLLDHAALEAVQGWLFVPAKRAGFTVAARVRIPIRFEISFGRPYSGVMRAGKLSSKEVKSR